MMNPAAKPEATSLVLAMILAAGATVSSPVVAEGGPAPMRIVAGTGEAGFADGAEARFNKAIRLAPWGESSVLVADIFSHAVPCLCATQPVMERVRSEIGAVGPADGAELVDRDLGEEVLVLQRFEDRTEETV